MDKRLQISMLDQWASNSKQISLSKKRLQEIDEWIDWEPPYEIGRRIDKTGPKSGPHRKLVQWMIQGLLLQYLYQLKDPQLEDHLIDRLILRRFAGLSLDQTVPDFTTFWRFRESLAGEELVEELICKDERSLFGDKAYARESLKQTARDKGQYYGILDKGKRNNPLSSTQKKRNRRHHQFRSQVEHPSASIKDRYGLLWA